MPGGIGLSIVRVFIFDSPDLLTPHIARYAMFSAVILLSCIDMTSEVLDQGDAHRDQRKINPIRIDVLILMDLGQTIFLCLTKRLLECLLDRG